MLSAIRKRQKGLLTIFISLISVVFVFWGFYGGMGDGQIAAADVAAVNGDGISVQDFQNQYQSSLQMYQNILKDKFTPDMAKRFNLKQVTLNQLIDQRVLVQGGSKLGLKVTDIEVKDAIVNTRVFQKDGQFSKEYYLLLLKNNRLTAKSYEKTVRLDLLRRKILDLINSHIQVSPAEMKANYFLKNDKANLEFIQIDPTSFQTKTSVTQNNVDQFLATPDEFKTAQDYYNENGNLYKQDHEVKAKHILIKGKTPESKKKLEDIQQTLTAENFADMAKKHSQDGSAKDGGDLGYFGKGKMVKAFEETAFSLKPGDVSNIVESQFGYHIIKVEQVRQERQKPFDEVKASIAKILLQDKKSAALAATTTEKIWAARNKPAQLKNLLKKEKLKWDETGSFSKGTLVIPKIGKAPEIKAQAFNLTKGQYADKFFKLRKRFFIVRMKKREKVDLEKFNKERKQILSQNISQKQNEAYYAWIKELKDSAKIVIRKAVLEQF